MTVFADIAAVVSSPAQLDAAPNSLVIGGWTSSIPDSRVTSMSFELPITVALTSDIAGSPGDGRASRTLARALAEHHGSVRSDASIHSCVRELDASLIDEMNSTPNWFGLAATVSAISIDDSEVRAFCIGDTCVWELMGGYLVPRPEPTGHHQIQQNSVPSEHLGGTQRGYSEPLIWTDRLHKDQRFLVATRAFLDTVGLDHVEDVLNGESSNALAVMTLRERSEQLGSTSATLAVISLRGA